MPGSPGLSAQDGPEEPIPDGWTGRIVFDSSEGAICAFEGNPPEGKILYSRPPQSGVVEAMVANVLKYAGLAPNFKVVEVSDNNAFATIHEGERILGFGPRYLEAISTTAGTDWGRLGVMAHEVGHHLQGHTGGLVQAASSHQRELQADEYAGFICGLMGSSREDSIAHTALMSEAGSDSHPPKSVRIEATQRGWLMAQHIRRTVREERSCPVFQFTGDGFERRTYEGSIGTSKVVVDLSRSPDRTVFGTYRMAVNGENRVYRFVGRSDAAVRRITLEEYFGCEPSATVQLVRSDSPDLERWTGSMVEPGGKEFKVEMARARVAPPAAPEPEETASTDHHYVTTMAGFPQRWFAVLSTETPYVSQSYRQSEAFPMDWIREQFGQGYRVTSVSGDANGWAVFMSKGSGYGGQRIIGPGPINETQYADLRDTGYRITALAGYENTWVMVMSTNSGLGEQRFTHVGPFRTSWIQDRLREDYRITLLAGDDNESGGSWMVVMSQGTGFGAQVYSDGSSFPREWIKSRWDEGYRITAASGYDNWRVVMTRSSGLGRQTYEPPSSSFPSDFITARWGRPHDKERKAAEEQQAGAAGELIFEEWRAR